MAMLSICKDFVDFVYRNFSLLNGDVRFQSVDALRPRSRGNTYFQRNVQRCGQALQSSNVFAGELLCREFNLSLKCSWGSGNSQNVARIWAWLKARSVWVWFWLPANEVVRLHFRNCPPQVEVVRQRRSE